MKILDASFIICIIHEARFPQIFEICNNKGYKLVIPKTVYEELKENKRTYNFLKLNSFFEVSEDIDPNCYEYFESRYPYLHKGEIGVICLGYIKHNQGHGYICIIDEKARNLKEVKNLRLTGTIGLLLWLKDLNDITIEECQLIYNRLVNSSFRISQDYLKLLLK